MKRPTLILLGTGLFASVGTAIFLAASYQPIARSAEFENFHLVGPTGQAYSIESFPSSSVLAIYFGYTTCQRSCPTALNSIARWTMAASMAFHSDCSITSGTGSSGHGRAVVNGSP